MRYKMSIIVIFLMISLLIPLSNSSSITKNYSKVWVQADGSELKVIVQPNSALLEVNRIYTYKITLEGKKIGSQQGFYTIAVRLRFISSNDQYIIDSGINSILDDIAQLGATKHVLIHLKIPSSDQFSLGPGESLKGRLEYQIYFTSEKINLDSGEMMPSMSAYSSEKIFGWEIIAYGRINNPLISSFQVLIIIIILIAILGTFFLLKPNYKTYQRDNEK